MKPARRARARLRTGPSVSARPRRPLQQRQVAVQVERPRTAHGGLRVGLGRRDVRGQRAILPRPDQLTRMRAAIDADAPAASSKHRSRATQVEVRTWARTKHSRSAARLPEGHPRSELLSSRASMMSEGVAGGRLARTPKKAKGPARGDARRRRPLNAWIAGRRRGRDLTIQATHNAPAADRGDLVVGVLSSSTAVGQLPPRGDAEPHDAARGDDHIDGMSCPVVGHHARREHLAFVHGG